MNSIDQGSSVSLSDNRDKLVVIISLVITAIIFIIDLSLPLGVAGGVPYVASILFSLQSSNEKHTILIAIACSILTFAGFFLSPEGSILWVVLLNRFLAIFVIWVTVILGILQKRSHAKSLESDIRFQVMADTEPLMIWQVDSKKRWEFISSGWKKFFDKKTFNDLIESIHPDDQSDFINSFSNAFNHQEEFQQECRILGSDGEYRYLFMHGTPLFRDSGSSFSGYIGTCYDITDKKKAESDLNENREIMYHQEKMAAIGTLAAGIVHEVGNPIASISGLAREIISNNENSPSIDSQSLEYIYSILEQTERLSSITRDVSEASSAASQEKQLYSINDVISHACRLVKFDKKIDDIKIILELENNLPAIEGIADNISQVLLNLINNAADACHETEGKHLIKITSLIDDDQITVEVEDNGKGIDSDLLSKVEEPFFTTKPLGKGTGLGLSLCHNLIRKQGGIMTIHSIPNQGTCMRFILPLSYDN